MTFCRYGGPFVTWSPSGRPYVCEIGWGGLVVLGLVCWALLALAYLLVAVSSKKRP